MFAWASLAGGFFAGIRSVDVVRVYENDDNRERLRRAQALAARRGATASQVALAWVLHQPFPTYALIGPRSIPELRESVAALASSLTILPSIEVVSTTSSHGQRLRGLPSG